MAAERGYDLLLCYASSSDTSQLERQLANRKMDGVILSRALNDDPCLDLLRPVPGPLCGGGPQRGHLHPPGRQ